MNENVRIESAAEPLRDMVRRARAGAEEVVITEGDEPIAAIVAIGTCANSNAHKTSRTSRPAKAARRDRPVG